MAALAALAAYVHVIRCGNLYPVDAHGWAAGVATPHTHATAAQVRECHAATTACYADWAAEAKAEQYADAIASWITTGGDPSAAGLYASAITSGAGWYGMH